MKKFTLTLLLSCILNGGDSSLQFQLNSEDHISKDKVDVTNTNEHKVDKDQWFAIDKLQHLTYSCLIALGCQYVLVNKMDVSENHGLIISSGLSFSAGILKELQDRRGKNGYFSTRDVVANLIGISIAALIIDY